MRWRTGVVRALGVAVVVAASTGVAQKTPDTRIDHIPGPSGQAGSVRIASAGNRVYVVWIDSRDGSWDVRFNRSTDAGETWLSSDLRLDTDAPGAADSGSPRLRAYGDDLYVVWEDRRNGAQDVYFNRSTDGGATWLASDVRIDTDGAGVADSNNPSVRAVGSRVYVLWEDERIGGESKIFSRHSTDGGTTWAPSDVRVDNSAAGVFCFSSGLFAEGMFVHAVWRDNRSATLDIWYNRSADGGATWGSSNIRIDTDPVPNPSFQPLITGSGSNLYVAWGDNRNGRSDLYFNRSTDNGATWLANDIRIDTSPPGSSVSEDRHMACSGSDVHLVWADWRNGTKDIYYNRSWDAGATWLAADIPLESDPPGANHSSLPYVASSGQNVYVAWEDYRNGPRNDIYFNRSVDRGATWLATDMRIDTDPAGVDYSRGPTIAAGPSHPYVAWGDYRGDNRGKVYFNIPFGFLPYGTGAAGSAGLVPQLTGNGFATPRGDVSLLSWMAVGGAPGVLLVGGGPGARVSVPFQGGTLLVASLVSAPLFLSGTAGVPGVGSNALPLTLPNDPAYVGVNLNFQAVFVDLGAPFGLSMTNAVEMWIG